MNTTNLFSGWNRLQDNLIDLSTQYGTKAIGAIIILVVGYFVVRWLSKIIQRRLEKLPMEPPVRTLIGRAIRLVLMLSVLVLAIDNAGIKITPLLAGIGVAGLGVGLAMQGVLGNLVAGLTIIFTKPFKVGEYVELAGVHGQVENIELFATTLRHPDMSRVIVPNRKIVGEILHNYGVIRQLELTVGVAYGSNLNDVMSALRELLAANSRVLKNPAPVLSISALADSSINVLVKPWTAVGDYGPAHGEIYAAIVECFRDRKIAIPFPQREIRMLDQGQPESK